MYYINSKTDKPNIDELVNTIKELMHRGITVGDLSSMYNSFVAERDEIAAEIYQDYGILNPNSSQQIIKYMQSLDSAEVYEYCYIDDKWTTNKDAMMELEAHGFQFATDILDYRKAKKYAESIKSMMDAKSTVDGKVRPSITLSKTNRINYVSPALMNIPKTLLWDIIKPSSPGNILISADIKNQEPNILFHIVGLQGELKEALTADNGLYEHIFEDVFDTRALGHILVVNGEKPGYVSNEELESRGTIPPVYFMPITPKVDATYYNGVKVKFVDIVNVVAPVGCDPSEIQMPGTIRIETVDDAQYNLPVIWDTIPVKKLKAQGIVDITGKICGLTVECQGQNRKEFKAAWNAMTYGAGLPGVKKICKNIDGEVLYKYFAGIPELAKYRSLCYKQAQLGNQSARTYFGTALNAGEPNKMRLKRILMDIPVQGTAADILSLLVRHIKEEIVNRKLENKLSIYYTRHDEVIFEVDKSWLDIAPIDEIKAEISDIVTHQVDDWIPFRVEVNDLHENINYSKSESSLNDDDPFEN